MPTAKKIPQSDLKTQIQALAKQQKQLEAELRKAKDSTLKQLISEFKKALKSNGLDLEDALPLLGEPKPQKKAKRGAKKDKVAPAPKLYQTGVTYKKPRGSETWVGGTKGRQPAWLKELLAVGRTYESLAVKK